jgi:hypothetical protein
MAYVKHVRGSIKSRINERGLYIVLEQNKIP